MENNLKVEIVKWIDEHESLETIREKVFIEEQKVTSQLDWDGMDQEDHRLPIERKAEA